MIDEEQNSGSKQENELDKESNKVMTILKISQLDQVGWLWCKKYLIHLH